LTPKYPATPREASWTPASHVSYSASRPAFTFRFKTSVTGPVIRPISSPPVIDFDSGLAVLFSIYAERGSAFPHSSWVATRRGLDKPVSSSPPFSTGRATFTASGAAPEVLLHA